jgi:hypothetical protein
MNNPRSQALAPDVAETGQSNLSMLLNLKQVYGAKLDASDGQIGHVKDFLFTDQDWTVRYVVADTGSWLSERLVLLSPEAFTNFFKGERLLVQLTREQIEQSPLFEAHKPVSRQQEEEYCRHYGYSNYWNEGAVWGLGVYPMTAPMPMPMERPARPRDDDPHLRSAQALSGYRIQNGEDVLGHVTDFLMDNKTWTIRYLIGATGSWFSGKEIVISPEDIERISYDDSKFFVHATKEAIHNSPDFHYTPGEFPVRTLQTRVSGHSLFFDR